MVHVGLGIDLESHSPPHSHSPVEQVQQLG